MEKSLDKTGLIGLKAVESSSSEAHVHWIHRYISFINIGLQDSFQTALRIPNMHYMMSTIQVGKLTASKTYHSMTLVRNTIVYWTKWGIKQALRLSPNLHFVTFVLNRNRDGWALCSGGTRLLWFGTFVSQLSLCFIVLKRCIMFIRGWESCDATAP